MLVTFCLCQKEALIRPVLYLSHFLKRHRETYYNLLQAVRDKGEWENWLKFFLRGVVEVANESTDTARKIVQLREDHRDKLQFSLGKGAGSGLRLLETMYQRPIFTVATVAQVLEVSPQAANSLTERLMKLGIIRETTGNKRNRIFIYDPYVKLFQD